MEFAQWVGREAFTAGTIDPSAPLDELEPLRALIGDARVVAIGESAHHVREFYLLRHRLMRFLVERCGFTVYAFEAPYVGSEPLDAWVRGGPGDLAELTGTPAMSLTGCPEMHDALFWMRAHNATAARPVRFAGTLAGDGGGSPLPELHRVSAHLRHTDPDALPLLERAIAVAGGHHNPSPFGALLDYDRVGPSVRDALTADLSRLLGRMETTTPRLDAAMTYMRGAWLVDHLHRDIAGQGLAIGSTALDTFMAESVLRRLEREPDTKIVLALHNVHLRTTPVEHDGPAGLFPAGYHLRKALGRAYVAIAATGNHGRIACGTPDPDEPGGRTFAERPLPEPAPGSIEAAFADAAIDDTAAVTVADLRGADVTDAASFRSFRMQDEFAAVPVFEALDAIAYVPRLHTTDRPRKERTRS